MTLEDFKKKAKKMPGSPGVYFFLGRRRNVLYIGKAASLRERVRSYFVKDIAQVRSPLVAKVIGEARSIDWRTTDSVLEALILEANLIKNYKPKGNTDSKDDKSWNWVVITKEDFPRILLMRGKELAQAKLHSPASGQRGNASEHNFAIRSTFGPFPHGLQLKEALKIIRKIFPYRDDSCTPGQGRPCFNRQIGLCPGVCTGEISKTDYQRVIRRIAMLFAGKKVALIKSLQRDMKKLSREERFEEAAQLRAQLWALSHIQDVSLIKDEYRAPHGGLSHRIEAYDVAHLRGAAAVGVMTVVEDGVAKRGDYRKFRIRAAKAGDDAGALREVLSRRLGHDEWPLPRLIAVDGAAAQMNAAKKVLEGHGMGIPVVGVVKDEKHRPRGIQGGEGLPAGRQGVTPALERDILLANAEAHRFAVSYHRRRSRAEKGI